MKRLRIVKDHQEEIDTIIWTVSGKVKEIRRSLESTKKNLIFEYDAFGNRIAKHVYDNQTLMLEKSTYYILDAQGNQLSMYEHIVDDADVKYYLTERNIYGSSRLGTLKDPVNMFNAQPLQSYGILGNRNYELSNHLGNVLTVISDIKYPLSSDNTTIDSYEVGISNVFDYSPFGAPLDGRTIENIFHHPSQNNGSQTPADIVEIYNNNFDNPPATGSPYLSTEVTLDANLSNASWTSSTGTFTNYNSTGAGSGKSIAISTASADTAYLTLTMDVDSGYELDISSYSFAHRSSTTGYDSYTLVVNGIEIGSGSIYVATSGSTLQSTGVVNANNTVSGVTGTVNVVLKLYGGTHGSSGTFRMDDFVLNGYVQEESSGYSSSDYFVSNSYRYQFNGMEADNEIKGRGNSYDFGARMYDPRVGRWLSVDPLAHVQPDKTPYHFVSNNPINRIDPTGMLDEWVEKDGQMMYDNRVTNQEDATALYGEGATYRPNGYTYTASDGSNIELGDYGFFKQNGQIKSSPDLAQNSLAYTNPTQAMANAQSEIAGVRGNYTASAGVIGFISTDAAIPDPTDVAWPKWVAYAVVGSAAAYYVAKMEREIEGIKRRAGGPQGVQYSLRATSSGNYPCFTCGGGTMGMGVGDVWKYGETTNPTGRYSDNWLRSNGLRQFNEFRGNQVQIKVMEKTKIYNYFLQNGHLPPGNKIFR